MKNYDLLSRASASRVMGNQLFRIMRVTTFILLIGCMHLSAASWSQTVTLRAKNQSLQQILESVEKQTGYWVMYSDQLISTTKPITIHATDMALTSFLDQVLKPQSMAYTIDAKNILIMSSKDRFATRRNQQHQPASMVSVPLQQRVIRGKVSDGEGNPLQSATVAIKGTSQAVFTDAQGNYEIETRGDHVVLVFTSVGFSNNEQVVGSRSTVDMVMIASASDLDEVVVVGYGTVKKSDLTGSVASIKADEISAFPAANVMQTLSGRASGVQVRQNNGSPGSAVSVRIRGTNSIQGSNEPLYVIDGFPLNGNPLTLNNNDIESIEILKDASAVAIYGSRGANGVVMITTKTGKQGATRIDYESNFGIQSLRKKLELMNAREYALFYNERRLVDGEEAYFTPEQINSFGEGFDWQDFVYRKAPIQNHSLNLSGGNEKTQFSVSGSVFDQQGIIKNSDYSRYSLRTNISHDINKKFKSNFSTVLSRITTARQNSGGSLQGGSLINASLVLPPTLTPYNDDGTYTVIRGVYPFNLDEMINPLNFINEMSDIGVGNRVLANASLSYEPIEGLIFKVQGGIENTDERFDYYKSTKFFDSRGEADVSTNQFVSLLNENTVSYNKTLDDKHSIAAVAGFTFQDFVSTSLSGSGSGFLSDVTETYGLSSAEIPGIPGSGHSKSVILSYLGRINYSFDNRFLATVSFRSDGASKYSQGNKWGYFPSAAFAWKLKEEAFLKDLSFLTDLKVRASWGKTGSQAIGAYATLNQLSGGKTIFGDALYNTFAPGTRLPGSLRWETTEQTDIGLDIALFQNRIQLTADYYNKVTRDLLNSVQLPVSMGFTSTIRNIGQIRNRGLEFSLTANVLDGPFKWDISGNIAFNKSRVLRLHDGQDILGGRIATNLLVDDVTLIREGEPFGVFYGYLENGYDDNGKIIYKDINTDGVVNVDDKVVLGDPNPKFNYGLNSFTSFKGFDLTLFIQGSYGNDIANISSFGNTLWYGYGTNMLKEVFYNHWTPENPDAKYPKISRVQSLRFSDRFIETGSFLRLRNIELGYNIAFKTTTRVRSAKVFISGQNLLTLSRYSWWDPEVNSRGGANAITQGVDYSTYPTSKSYQIGFKIGI